MPVTAGRGRVLYLALADQARTATTLHALTGDADRALLADRLRVWVDPPSPRWLFDTSSLTHLAARLDADTLIVDDVTGQLAWCRGGPDERSTPTADPADQALHRLLHRGVQVVSVHSVQRRLNTANAVVGALCGGHANFFHQRRGDTRWAM